MDIVLRRWALATVLAAAACCNALALTGSWRGYLSLGLTKLPLVFNFSDNDGDRTSCTMDSPAQGAAGIPVDVTFCSEDSINVVCGMIGASFAGRVSDASIVGKFVQRGISLPLILKPDSPLEERRPQTPRPPFPYTEIDTVFTSADGTELSGTLTLPADMKGRSIPAVVMVTGSGPQNRDEELFDHKPFAVIADFLARNGVASLRYDDRGTGRSTGDFLKGTTFIFKDDAKSGVDFLRRIKGIGKVGVLGHSEGGTIALMLGAEKVPDFVISLAGMAESGKETLMRQNSAALDKSGISGKEKENSLALIGRLFDIMARESRDGVSGAIDVDSVMKASGLDVPPVIVQSLKSTLKNRTPWFDTFLTLDPGSFLSEIECPVLAVNGDKDTQVNAAANIALIKSKVTHTETHILPDLNHLMQHCETGDVSEYGTIRETLSPEVLDIIRSFLLR